MKNLAIKIKEARLRKLPVMAALTAALVVPTAINAYAQENTPDPQDPLVVANVDENGDLQNEQPDTDPDPVDPADETETEVVETPDPEEAPVDDETDEVPAPVDPTADVASFMAFANAEHPGVEVESYAFVYKHGIKAFKVTYTDGYTVFIASGDFSTLKVVDNHKRVRKCQKRVMSHRKYFKWWNKYTSYHDFWKHYQQDPDAATEGIDPESESGTEDSNTNTEARIESVRGVSTDSASRKKPSKNSAGKRDSWKQNSRNRFDR